MLILAAPQPQIPEDGWKSSTRMNYLSGDDWSHTAVTSITSGGDTLLAKS